MISFRGRIRNSPFASWWNDKYISVINVLTSEIYITFTVFKMRFFIEHIETKNKIGEIESGGHDWKKISARWTKWIYYCSWTQCLFPGSLRSSNASTYTRLRIYNNVQYADVDLSILLKCLVLVPSNQDSSLSLNSTMANGNYITDDIDSMTVSILCIHMSIWPKWGCQLSNRYH